MSTYFEQNSKEAIDMILVFVVFGSNGKTKRRAHNKHEPIPHKGKGKAGTRGKRDQRHEHHSNPHDCTTNSQHHLKMERRVKEDIP